MKIGLITISLFVAVCVILFACYPRTTLFNGNTNVGKVCAGVSEPNLTTNSRSLTRSNATFGMPAYISGAGISDREAFVSTNIAFSPIVLSREMIVVAPILDVVSNAVLIASRILQSKKYQICEFSQTIWYLSDDKEHLTSWTLFPYRTNHVICSIESRVYKNESMTLLDRAQSFNIKLNPVTGKIDSFFWLDHHESFFSLDNDTFKYGYKVKENIEIDLLWSKNGELIHSNMWDLVKYRETLEQYRKDRMRKEGPMGSKY